MKRTNSFIEGFKIVNIEITTNIDDEMIKSISPPKTSTFDYFMKNVESEEVKSSPPTGFLDFFMNRKNNNDNYTDIVCCLLDTNQARTTFLAKPIFQESYQQCVVFSGEVTADTEGGIESATDYLERLLLTQPKK